ncbi:MAG: hypothetical protein JNK21_02135, partial [Rhodospirillaceae bacterium]|nr:hypothetical protein [Rhodospirillaceae bacterium]
VMDPTLILALVSAAAMIVLVLRGQHATEKVKLVLGGVAVAAGLVAVSLMFERL